MDGLVVKDVEFNGAVLKAAQDVTNTIWVGVRWVCEGIGLTAGQVTNERRKIANDYVLSRGNANLHLPTSSGEQEVLCLKLDYLPLWLAKISITPTMQRENPEAAERLAEYQLKAKDVLAAAFLEKKPVPAPVPNIIQIPLPQLPNYDAQFETLNKRLDDMDTNISRFNADMHRMLELMMEWKEELKQIPQRVEESNNEVVEEREPVETYRAWKKRMYIFVDKMVEIHSGMKDRADGLRYIYAYMRRNYGICWEQILKEYMNQHGLEKKPSTIEVCWNDEMTRSIFESVAKDMAEPTPEAIEEVSVETNEEAESAVVDTLRDTLARLIAMRGDTSKNGCATHRMIYSRMERKYGIDWDAYVGENKKKKIRLATNLEDKFYSCVKELLEMGVENIDMERKEASRENRKKWERQYRGKMAAQKTVQKTEE